MRGGLARWLAKLFLKWLMFGKLVWEEEPRRGSQNRIGWCRYVLKDDFQAFGATHGSTDDGRQTFGIPKSCTDSSSDKGFRGTRG